MGTAGGTFGILTSGVRVSKTFPFGPALAVGAAYAMSTISLSKDGGFIKPGA
jgi:prepilin signal peptidase PulO-like enzyme (type II secretory pathway)